MPFKIDKGIPIPPEKGGARYPFNSMEVGDSFFVSDPGKGSKSPLRKQTSSAAFSFARSRTGYRFATRSVDGGFRVWRVAVDD